MKLKISRVHVRTFKRFAMVAALIGSAAFANAQFVAGDTFTYFYGQNAQGSTAGFDGSYTGTLAGAGYDSYQYDHNNGSIDNGPVNSSKGGNLVGINRLSTVIDLGDETSVGNSVGTGIDGSKETITSITLYLYVMDVSPDSGSYTFDLYTGAGTTTGSQGSFSVTAGQENGYIAITIPSSIAFSPFTIGYGLNNPTQRLLNTASENHGTASFLPGFRVNTEMVLIPEPSTALLGAVGAFALLRRRRA